MTRLSSTEEPEELNPIRGEELRMERMSWTDVQDKIAHGYKTVVFGVGATEQHGPHLPIAVDTLGGTTTSCGVAAELGNALVAPVIRPGYSPHHMDFPGTITLRRSTLVAIIVDYCTSLAAHGFETIVVISSHGGNTTCVNYGVQEAQDVLGPKVTVIPITNSVGFYKADYDRNAEGLHATKLETSRVMAVAPTLVHIERAKDWTNPFSPEIKDKGALLGLRGTKYFAPDGTMGLPTGANPELGREAAAIIARNMAEQIRAILAQIRKGLA